MSRHTILLTAALTLVVGVSLSADRVRLRSGKVVTGTFIGADSRTVRVLLEDGRVSEVRASTLYGTAVPATLERWAACCSFHCSIRWERQAWC